MGSPNFLSIFTNGNFSSDIIPELPEEDDVRIGVQYGLSGTEFTGTLVPLPNPNPGGPIVGDKLTVIQNGLITMITGMRNLNGYNYDYLSTQQEDFTKVTSWPHINVYLMPNEDNLDEPEHACMNAFRNEVYFELHCFHKLSSETTNSVFNIDSTLNNMLHDVKKMIGYWPTGGGLWEYIMYDGCERGKIGIADDIIMPKKLIVRVRISYTQDSTEPNNNGYV